jgi:hypothetical protein
MSKEDPNLTNYFHNKGEKDYAEKEGYHIPNDLLGGIFNNDREIEQNQAYSQGWDNAKEQDKDK